jgi:hypothetical protein
MRTSRAKVSSISLRTVAFSSGIGTTVRGGSVIFGKLPNHFWTSSLPWASWKSPARVRVALLGTYHWRKKLFTSSTLAVSRSSWRPIVRKR